ncbi:MAG: serine/threonine protein kinase [Acidobacteria bacterium]|nr:serine/threonine protein kinase [Acidobacteriota bacterium]
MFPLLSYGIARQPGYNERTLPVPKVWTDTTNFMSIERDHVIELEGERFLVRCNEREGRFGLDEQPKFWVKRAAGLATGKTHILKMVFGEEFKIRVGALEVRCCRSAEKEGRVLDVVRGDASFMQGRTAPDSRGNLVRIIDFIPGPDLLSYLHSIRAPHEEYARTMLPGVLARVAESCRAIQRLHDAGVCHGDIRNDHLIVERKTGRFRWIDFDLNQDFPDFDVWSLGNVLHCVAAKGFTTFGDAIQARPELAGRLVADDASVFFPHRVMNLRKVYPYLPERLNRILLRFSAGAEVCFDRVSQIAGELAEWQEGTECGAEAQSSN